MQPSNSQGTRNSDSKRNFALVLVCTLSVAAIIGVSVLGFANMSPEVNAPAEVDSSGVTGTIVAFHAPEYEVGGAVIALIVCLATFTIYKKRKQN